MLSDLQISLPNSADLIIINSDRKAAVIKETMDPIHNHIPEEIMFVILSMLPVKSLRRLMCVSKLWFSIISDSYFKSAHFARSKSRPKLLISITRLTMLGRIGTGDDIAFYSIDYPEEHHESRILHVNAHDGSIVNPYSGVMSAPVSGLICYPCHKGISIGNPITGEFTLTQFPGGRDVIGASTYQGFDPIDKTPVILLLEFSTHRRSSVCPLHLQENQWHNNPPPQPLPIPFIPSFDGSSVACINGVIYFAAQDFLPVNSIGEHLYAFDIRLKRFERFQDPPDPKFMATQILEYKGRVALVGSENYYVYDHPHMKEIKLWILEDPKKQSWRLKSFVVPWRGNELGLRIKLLGATHRGELMFANDRLSKEGSFDLFLYTIDTNTLRRFKVDGFGPTCPNLPYREVRLGTLIESLYSPR